MKEGGNTHTDAFLSSLTPLLSYLCSTVDRTIRSLFRQRHMKGWRVEVVVVMDGSDRIDESMGERLHDIFGVTFNTGNEDDPFVKLPGAETIIVEPANWEAAMTRTPAMENTIGGYTLVVKRSNHRKANSQMWWLGPHGSTLGCRYSLATDCGTVFGRTATIHLIRRLDAEPDLHAVTGFQRIMTSDMQGDGAFEWLNNPAAHILRMCQRFEFEVDHVSFKAVYDTFGCMHVIPGPCGLFRYRAMGSMREGLMKQYFSLFQNSNQGLIVGNVELVEDRIPGTLLSFPQKENVKDLNIRPEEGWPRTGFVHDAIFYIEAEKPLSQLVKQRRRWTNGTFATYLWMVMEGIITRSNQDPTNKVVSWLLIMISIVQGMTVRLFGPALLIVWMFRFGLFLPDLVIDPRVMFDPDLSLVELEIEEERLPYGLLLSGLYTLLHVAFIIGHVPRAKPGKGRTEITRHTDPLWYQNDKNSAYRGWLFIPVVVVNAFVILLYILNAVGIVVTLGWKETPFIVRMLMVICFSPFILGFLDGLVRRDLRCMWGMMISIPGALPLMIFFTVWLPAYSTTRLSDLTWGNRVGAGLDESSQALKRANDGMRVAIFLIAFNLLVSLVVIFFMQFYSETFPIFVVSYTAILSVTLVISFQDLVVRFLTCHYCYNSVSDDELIEEEDEVHEPEPEEESEADGYTELESESAAPNDDHKTTTTNNKAIEDHSLVGASINGGPGDYQKMDESTGDYQKMEDTPPGYMQDTPPGYMQDKPPGYIHT